jgi:hypothetical protein
MGKTMKRKRRRRPLTEPSDSPPPPFPEEDFSEVPVAVDAVNWRGDGTDRSSLWPLCKQDEDDIYLMATMQSCMNDAGFWAGEEDEADFYFGPSTGRRAVLLPGERGSAGDGRVRRRDVAGAAG